MFDVEVLLFGIRMLQMKGRTPKQKTRTKEKKKSKVSSQQTSPGVFLVLCLPLPTPHPLPPSPSSLGSVFYCRSVTLNSHSPPPSLLPSKTSGHSSRSFILRSQGGERKVHPLKEKKSLLPTDTHRTTTLKRTKRHVHKRKRKFTRNLYDLFLFTLTSRRLTLHVLVPPSLKMLVAPDRTQRINRPLSPLVP